MEVIKKYTETIKFCAMMDGFGGQKRKGMFFVFNNVTILRTYADIVRIGSDEDFMDDIEKEYHKSIRTVSHDQK